MIFSNENVDKVTGALTIRGPIHGDDTTTVEIPHASRKKMLFSSITPLHALSHTF